MARRGFTIIELVIVMAIIVLMFSLGLAGLGNSQKQLLFSNAYERIIQLVREARSNAVTGKATLDYTDYDADGCTDAENHAAACTLLPAENDYVTPANYGVDFDTEAGVVTLFADLHNGNEGTYEAPDLLGTYESGKDLAIAQFTISAPLKVVLVAGWPRTIFYSPIFADFSPNIISPGPFFIFGVSEVAGERYRCSKIHPIAGVPEVATEEECQAAT